MGSERRAESIASLQTKAARSLADGDEFQGGGEGVVELSLCSRQPLTRRPD